MQSMKRAVKLVRFDNPGQKKKLVVAAKKKKWSLNRFMVEASLQVAQQTVEQGQVSQISQ